MKRAAALAAVLAATPAAAAPGSDLLARMAALNPNLHAFTATVHAHVAMKSFPFVSADLVGTYYYQEPDKTKVVFTSGVPLLAQQFSRLYARIESPSHWRDVYAVTLVSDDGRTAVFRLVPRKHGNVDRIDATVDEKNATVSSLRWNYANGGYAQMSNRYGQAGGNTVVRSQSGHVDEPGYVADVSSTIDDYKINPELPQGVFDDRR